MHISPACRLVCFPSAGVLAALLALSSGSTAAEPPARFVAISQENGHLVLTTCLPPGRSDFSAVDDKGLVLDGFVLVQGQGESSRLRMFRLRGLMPAAAADPGQRRQPSLPGEFSIALRPTTSPDHYAIDVRTVTADEGGEIVVDDARLARNCCGYHVTASRNGQGLAIGRAPLFSVLARETPETYGRFAELAQHCCRPGFEFVPTALPKPTGDGLFAGGLSPWNANDDRLSPLFSVTRPGARPRP